MSVLKENEEKQWKITNVEALFEANTIKTMLDFILTLHKHFSSHQEQ